MIVVDTNVISYLYLNSDRSSQVEQVLLKDASWAAPVLWRSEFCNVLAFYIRKKILTPDEAQSIMAEAINLMQGREYSITPREVISLVAASTCSAYDCEYVALAKDLDVPLVTADKQIQQQFPEHAVSIEQYLGNTNTFL